MQVRVRDNECKVRARLMVCKQQGWIKTDERVRMQHREYWWDIPKV